MGNIPLCSLGLLCLEPIKLKVMLLQGCMNNTFKFQTELIRLEAFFIKQTNFKKYKFLD